MRNLKLSETERKRIAHALCLEIDSCEQAKRPLVDMWNDHEHMYQADASAESPEIVKGYGGYAMPLWKPVLDRIINHIYTAFFSQKPTVQCIDITGRMPHVDRLERTLDNLADKQGLELEFKRALRCAGNTNIGTICVRPTLDKDGLVNGLRAKYYNPQKIYAYPPESESFADVKTAGYHYTEMLYRVRKKQKQGEYFECKVLPGADPREGMPGSDVSDLVRGDAASAADEKVKIAVLVSELDLGQFRDTDAEDPSDTDGTGYKRYVVRLAVDSEEILSIEEYGSTNAKSGKFTEYGHIEYVEVKMQPEEEDGIFSKYSMAYTMKALQDTFSDIFTTVLQGNQLSAFGVTAIVGDTQGKKFEVLKPGEVLHLPEGCQVQKLTLDFNGNALFSLLNLVMDLADRFTGLGSLAAGQETKSGTTATEIEALLGAIQTAKDQYTQGVSAAIARIYELNLMYLRHHYWDLKAAYGDAIEIGYRELQDLNVRLEVTGKSGASNPQATLRKLFAVLKFAQENPGLGIDTRKLVLYMLSTMDLPFAVETLMLSPKDMLLVATQQLNPMELEVAKMVAKMNPGPAGPGGGQQINGSIGPTPQGIPPGGPVPGAAIGPVPGGNVGGPNMAPPPQVLGDAQGGEISGAAGPVGAYG